jgi:hypothetical protein
VTSLRVAFFVMAELEELDGVSGEAKMAFDKAGLCCLTDVSRGSVGE